MRYKIANFIFHCGFWLGFTTVFSALIFAWAGPIREVNGKYYDKPGREVDEKTYARYTKWNYFAVRSGITAFSLIIVAQIVAIKVKESRKSKLPR
jgi:hypothetical protein